MPCLASLILSLAPQNPPPPPATPLYPSNSSPSNLTISCHRAWHVLSLPLLSSSLPEPVSAQPHHSGLSSRITSSGKPSDHPEKVGSLPDRLLQHPTGPPPPPTQSTSHSWKFIRVISSPPPLTATGQAPQSPENSLRPRY